MTNVRQRRTSATVPPRKTPSRKRASGVASGLGPSKLAQVRLRADEMATLREVMRTLDLPSTSDALREGLRLLSREAAEVAASNEVRSFYGDAVVPLPDGVAPATEEELSAADEIEW
jgi:hypothetical protein